MSEDNTNQGFKVQDKRRFDEQGQEKDRLGSSSSDAPNNTSSNNFSTISEESVNPAEEQITLGSFVMSLATQGMMQLGEMPTPDGFSIPIDIAHAKQTIDLISMLQEKTKGNQDQSEEKLFQEVLYSLRMAFVKKKKEQ